MTATNPNSEFIQAVETASGTRTSQRNLAVFLRELRGYKVTQPLVFALANLVYPRIRRPQERSIARLINRNLSRLATFVLRTAFVAPKFEPSHFETEFSNYAKNILTADNMPDDAFATFLRECDRSGYGVLDNSRFQEAMAEARMTGGNKLKQFLLGINGSRQHDVRLFERAPVYYRTYPAEVSEALGRLDRFQGCRRGRLGSENRKPDTDGADRQ